MFGDSSKNAPLWITLVLALGGMFALQRVKVSSNAPLESVPVIEAGAGKANEDRAGENNWLRPLETFLGHTRRVPASPPVSPPPLRVEIHLPFAVPADRPATNLPPETDPVEFDPALITRLRRQVDRLEFLIATVADPKETQANYRFDLQLDALHKAVGADGMVLDGYHFPWDKPNENPAAHQEPGVLLYRKAVGQQGKKSDLLLVFVVGELPTTGIHKPAFAEAVSRFVRLKTSFAGLPEESTLSISGPIFSGSGDSLATAIAQANEKHRGLRLKFNVITGSANVIDVQRFNNIAGKSTTFHSTLVRNHRLRSALIAYVTRNNVERTQVAWLAESSSGTGASSLVDTSESVDDRVDMYEFLFPLNIARVREGYAEQGRREQAGQPVLGPGRYRLAFPFGETSTARDLPRMQTPQMTAPASEIVLSQMLNTIRLRRIKYVVISSIDARDPIFLAEMVRRHCPDAQLMLISPDIMQLHSEFRSVLHGALVASTHSLNPQEQDWCFPFGKVNGKHRYRVMASQSYYGIYNSVVFLRGVESNKLTLSSNVITKGPEWKDHPPPLPIAYGSPLSKEPCYAPPVWISRLGPTGFHPVWIEPTNDRDDPELIRVAGIAPQAEPQFNGRIPMATRSCALFWLAAGAVYWLAWRRKSARVSDSSWPDSFMAMTPVFRASMTATFIFMLALWSLLMFAPLLPQSDIGVSGGVLNLIHLLGCLGLAVLLLRLLGDDLWQAIRHGGRAPAPGASVPQELAGQTGVLELLGYTRPLMFVVIATIIVGAVIVVLMQIREFWIKPATFVFWFTSWSDLWNGISYLPAIQFLAATAILLAYGMFHQVSLLQRRGAYLLPSDDFNRQRVVGDLWSRLLFPLLKRYEWLGIALYRLRHRLPAEPLAAGRSNWIVLAAVIAIGLGWLGYALSQLPSTDFFSTQLPWIQLPINGIPTLFLVICAYWFLRYMKLVELMRSFLAEVEGLRKRVNWTEAFRDITVPSLADLLIWPHWPSDDVVKAAARDLERLRCNRPQLVQGDIEAAQDKLFVVSVHLYVRQLCFHCSRLLMGILLSALLIYLAANSYPYHLQPLLRLTSSCILAAVAVAMVWFYIKLDRDPIISAMVGTPPHQIQFNWSLVQTLVPALGLALLAFFGQAFPDLWHWIRDTIEPARRV